MTIKTFIYHILKITIILICSLSRIFISCHNFFNPQHYPSRLCATIDWISLRRDQKSNDTGCVTEEFVSVLCCAATVRPSTVTSYTSIELPSCCGCAVVLIKFLRYAGKCGILKVINQLTSGFSWILKSRIEGKPSLINWYYNLWDVDLPIEEKRRQRVVRRWRQCISFASIFLDRCDRMLRDETVNWKYCKQLSEKIAWTFLTEATWVVEQAKAAIVPA